MYVHSKRIAWNLADDDQIPAEDESLFPQQICRGCESVLRRRPGDFVIANMRDGVFWTAHNGDGCCICYLPQYHNAFIKPVVRGRPKKLESCIVTSQVQRRERYEAMLSGLQHFDRMSHSLYVCANIIYHR